MNPYPTIIFCMKVDGCSSILPWSLCHRVAILIYMSNSSGSSTMEVWVWPMSTCQALCLLAVNLNNHTLIFFSSDDWNGKFAFIRDWSLELVWWCWALVSTVTIIHHYSLLIAVKRLDSSSLVNHAQTPTGTLDWFWKGTVTCMILETEFWTLILLTLYCSKLWYHNHDDCQVQTEQLSIFHSRNSEWKECWWINDILNKM